MTDRPVGLATHAFAGALGGILGLLAVYSLAIVRGTGGFEYPLDDVYIHLAMANQIANGGYGVNTGEFASAASSPLYPFLLAPFSGMDVERFVPLLLNVLALGFAGALLGGAFAFAGLGVIGIALAAFAPLALGMVTTAYTGMENMLHGAASLMIVTGLWRAVRFGEVGWLLIAGVVLAPALRLEGLALSLLAGGAVFLLGHRAWGMTLMVLGILPVAAFSLFLISLGLDPLPNSVVAKLASSGADEGSALVRLWSRFSVNVGHHLSGKLLTFATVALILLSLRAQEPRYRIFGLAISAAGLAHLVFGSMGWMDRYENYALISVVAALALLSGVLVQPVRLALVGAAVAIGALVYVPNLWNGFLWNVRAMQLQQREMARFAEDFAGVPVAVNDLGHVVWRNPHYVLDLYGLASKDALAARLSSDGAEWVPPLIEERGVGLVMIYDGWLGDLVQPDWVKLGELNTLIPAAFIGGFRVSFYATPNGDPKRLRAQIERWVDDLPPGATFDFEGVN